MHYFDVFSSFFLGINSKEYQWNCSAFDSDTRGYFLPNLEASNSTAVQQLASENTIITSSPGFSYVYPVPSAEVNCSGTVKLIEYCYSGTVSEVDIEHHLFTLSTLSILPTLGDGNSNISFKVLFTKEITTIPTFENCSQDGITIFCCDVATLIEMEQFQLPAPNFAFGVSLPLSAVHLLAFSPQYLQPSTVRQYQINVSLIMGSLLNIERNGW